MNDSDFSALKRNKRIKPPTGLYDKITDKIESYEKEEKIHSTWLIISVAALLLVFLVNSVVISRDISPYRSIYSPKGNMIKVPSLYE